MAEITAELTEGTTVRVSTERHTWYGDEPPAQGGADQGPTPYEQLLGALASCTCITLRLYCERKGWKLAGVAVTYRYDRVHARDCEDCESDAEGYLDRIQSHIVIEGDFDDAQRARLKEVAVRCPVHKTLDRGIDFGEEAIQVV